MRKSMIALILASTLATSTVAYASTAYVAPSFGGQPAGRTPVPVEVLAYNHANNLNRLREKALATRAREGGTLSDRSRAEYQRALDRINADYARRLRNNGFASVTADGADIRGASANGIVRRPGSRL